MEMPNSYGMDDVEDLYAKVQKKTISVFPNQPETKEIYSFAQNVPCECEYDHITRSRGMLNNNVISTSRNFAIEWTNRRKVSEQKCIFKNLAVILGFLSLLIGIAAIGLVFIFNSKPISNRQHSILLMETIRNFTHEIEILKLEQYNHSTNLEAQLQALINRTTDLEKQKGSTQRKLSLLATKNQTNPLNNSLITLQNDITDIQNYAKGEKILKEFRLVNSAITLLKLKQSKHSINLEALYQVVQNKANNLEKLKKGFQRRYNQLTNKNETNELKKTLIRLEKNTTHQQNFISLLLHAHQRIDDTEWLTLSNGFQYRRTNEKKMWKYAKQDCQLLGGDVASVGIRDVSIRTFLLSYFLTKSENGYWIGLKDRGDNEWHWIDNQETVATNDTIWNDNEPNRPIDEDCAVLAKRQSRVGAEDVLCSREDIYGICEKAANES